MKNILLALVIFSSLNNISYSQNYNNPGKDYLTPADFNFPVRVYLWDLTGDDPFIDASQKIKVGLAYNYSSSEKYFNTDGEKIFVKESFRQFNKGLDGGGYFRKHGALLWIQYNFDKKNKLTLRLPFTFTEINSYSSTTDVKPQPEFIKPRGPFQDAELSYTRKLVRINNVIDIFAGAGISFPTSRPKRYLDNPHGGNGDRWTSDLNAYINFTKKNISITTGGKFIYKFASTSELFTPRPFGIGYPYLYDTTEITFNEMNTFITSNPYESEIKAGYHFIYDFIASYEFKFGLKPALQFQYFKGSGDEFGSNVPAEFRKINSVITPVNFLTKLDGGNTGTVRIYLKQSFEKLTGSKFDAFLGFGASIFGKNSQGETNLFFGINGYY